jgi:Na+/H+ antiporter NhaD/arsenite permease-like protein
MPLLIILVFLLSYLAIALEHPLQINKSASALIGAGALWSIYALTSSDLTLVNTQLASTLEEIAEIVFFLMGAMTIVEVIDSHNGFAVVTSRITTKSLPALLWLISLITFFLSAVLDNLTTTIVMVSVLKKLLGKREDRLFFAGIVVIAANAGGAWSPIGDVTTTMLWIGGQITPLKIIPLLFLPALANIAVPLVISSIGLRGKQVSAPALIVGEQPQPVSVLEQSTMFFLGLGVLVAVPAFKALTHLPPFIGVLLGLGLVWLVGDLLHRNKPDETKTRLNLTYALTRIDMASVVFFIGILLAVATLEHTHLLAAAAMWLETTIGRLDIIVMLIGLLSAIVDNVPLVASAIGMYSLEQHPADSFLWEFLAYCAGTGGSILIIGSAAGIAAMGLEKIEFTWYLKKISGLAILGYFAGAAIYILSV